MKLKDKVHALTDISDDEIIQAIYVLLKRNDIVEKFERYNEELTTAEANIDRGQFVTHEDLINQVKSW
jgi:predicted transcriptional regulator